MVAAGEWGGSKWAGPGGGGLSAKGNTHGRDCESGGAETGRDLCVQRDGEDHLCVCV